MKAYVVNYSNGKFFLENGDELILKENEAYTLTGNVSNFREEKRQYLVCLSSEDKKKSLIQSGFKVEKIVDANTILEFEFGFGERIKGQGYSRKLRAKVLLLEDLYIQRKSDKKGDEDLHWQASPVVCQLVNLYLNKELLPSMQYQADSLNKFFAKTVQYVAGDKRSTACDVFHAFKIPEANNLVFDKREILIPIGNLRRAIALSYNKSSTDTLYRKK